MEKGASASVTRHWVFSRCFLEKLVPLAKLPCSSAMGQMESNKDSIRHLTLILSLHFIPIRQKNGTPWCAVGKKAVPPFRFTLVDERIICSFRCTCRSKFR